MNQDNVQLWNEVTADLQSLRRLFSANSKAEEVFDEFIDRNELELALHTICDFLLEREQLAAEDRDVDAIETLHERMQISDKCVAAQRKQRKKRLVVLCNKGTALAGP